MLWTLSTPSTSLLSHCECGRRRSSSTSSRSSTATTTTTTTIMFNHRNAEMQNSNSRSSSRQERRTSNISSNNRNTLPTTDTTATATATTTMKRRCRCQSDAVVATSRSHRHRQRHHHHHQQHHHHQHRNHRNHRRSGGGGGGQHWMLWAAILLGIVCDFAEGTLRNVNLLVEPPAVRRGQSVALRCDYELDGAPLYSIKFYRGQMEFYRYTPGEYPHTKVFPYPGIRVDESSSNATLVLIRNVSFGLSGNYSCEVTADAPLYSTATAYAQMQVVEFPEKRPLLFTDLTRYEPGDVLRANCSTPPSRPRAELRFTINNVPVATEETQYIRTVDNLIASRLSLKLQLQSLHFSPPLHGNGANAHMTNALSGNHGGGGGAVGGLVLRCTAQIGDLYQEYKEIELGTPQKDPVPARVTLSSSTGLRNFFETYFSTSGATAATTGRQTLNIIPIVLLLLFVVTTTTICHS